jgi:hypothetical protein
LGVLDGKMSRLLRNLDGAFDQGAVLARLRRTIRGIMLLLTTLH